MDKKMKQEVLDSWISWKHDIKDMNRSEWNQRDQSIMDAIELILRKELEKMIEKQMIRLMLNKKFYTRYKGVLSPSVFSGDISSLYDTIQKAHDKYEEDIKVW
ncbi:MAG: hypothetical protein CM15mV108_280 [uncultured marine virus]|nr:MAG: hypothetical protein CM15mV108_280 [uncultured marine virus]